MDWSADTLVLTSPMPCVSSASEHVLPLPIPHVPLVSEHMSLSYVPLPQGELTDNNMSGPSNSDLVSILNYGNNQPTNPSL